MIEITLYWWMVPAALVALGVVAGELIARKHSGDWDFVTPVLAFGAFAFGVVAAIGVVVGKLLA